jgi:hypothetical protein
MRQFIAAHTRLIQGMLNGHDRMLFRGTLRFLAFVEGMTGFMKRRRLPHKDFMAWPCEFQLLDGSVLTSIRPPRLCDKPFRGHSIHPS